MESAIPGHLRREPTRTRRIPDDYVPPYPSFVARHAPTVNRVVMAYFGLQQPAADAVEGGATSGDARTADDARTGGHAKSGGGAGAAAGASTLAGQTDANAALADLAARFGGEDGPGHWDRARTVDDQGYRNVLTIAYWDEPARFDRWYQAHGEPWLARGDAGGPLGYFVEIIRPSVERYETLFSAHDRPEGIAVLAEVMSDEVQEHAYWGGARERIPLSQTDAMAPSGRPGVETKGRRQRIRPHENLCLIRSGQDWGDTDADERRLYLETVEPVLAEGMSFLTRHGLDVACYSNRYLRVIDAHGRDTEKSFGLSWWKSLAALERWAESHPTHIAIFGAAMKYLSTLGPAARLRLYHEVSVVAADEQAFEYVNCHPDTGMLRAG